MLNLTILDEKAAYSIVPAVSIVRVRSTMTNRSCGACSACCKTHAVFEIEKPQGVWCPHCPSKQSCDIYEERPPSCQSFRCAWLNGSGGEEERPDLVRIVCTNEVVYCLGQPVNWCTMMEVSHGALVGNYGQERTMILVREGWVVEHFPIDLHNRKVRIFLPNNIPPSAVPFLMRQLPRDTSGGSSTES